MVEFLYLRTSYYIYQGPTSLEQLRAYSTVRQIFVAVATSVLRGCMCKLVPPTAGFHELYEYHGQLPEMAHCFCGMYVLEVVVGR